MKLLINYCFKYLCPIQVTINGFKVAKKQNVEIMLKHKKREKQDPEAGESDTSGTECLQKMQKQAGGLYIQQGSVKTSSHFKIVRQI